MIIREFGKDFDNEWLLKFDASFSTEYIYRAELCEMSFVLVKEKLESSFYKSYSLNDLKNLIQTADYFVVADASAANAGFATVKYEAWNKRAVLTGIFVTPESKGKGIGRALVNSAINYAQTKSARCLWLETQNVNYPAIQFYTKLGFKFCGFDQTLYDPVDVSSAETALYFALFS